MKKSAKGVALIPYEGDGDDEGPGTRYEQFVIALIKHQPGPHRIAADNVTWLGFPIETMLMHGLWIVYRKAAEKLGVRLGTEGDLFENVGPRVDHLIEAGLLFGYRTMKDAAADFERSVFPAVRSEIAKRPVGVAFHPSELWQVPVAQFFIKLLRLSQDKAAEIAQKTAQLREDNVILGSDIEVLLDLVLISVPDYLRVLSLHDYAEKDGMQELFMDNPGTSRDYAANDSGLHYIQAAKDFLAKEEPRDRQLQLVLRKLPCRLEQIHALKGVDFHKASLQYTWLNTQLLLAAANGPDSDAANGHHYLRGLKKIRNASGPAIITEMIKRLEGRGLRLNAQEQHVLRSEAAKRLHALRGVAIAVNTGAREIYFLEVQDHELDVDSDEALLAAIHGDDKHRGELPSDPVVLCKKIDWLMLSLEQVEQVIEDDTIPIRMVAACVGKMSPAVRASIAESLLETIRDPTLTESFIKKGWYKPETAFVIHHPELFLLDRQTQIARRLLLDAGSETYNLDRSDLPCENVGTFFAQLPYEHLRRALGDPAVCYGAARYVSQWLAERKELSPVDVYLIQAKAGASLWQKLILVSEVLLRDGMYEDPEAHNRREVNVTLPAWETLSEKPSAQQDLKHLSLKKERLGALLRKYSEETVFAWIYPGAKNKKLVAAFIKRRDQYYATVALRKTPRKR